MKTPTGQLLERLLEPVSSALNEEAARKLIELRADRKTQQSERSGCRDRPHRCHLQSAATDLAASLRVEWSAPCRKDALWPSYHRCPQYQRTTPVGDPRNADLGRALLDWMMKCRATA